MTKHIFALSLGAMLFALCFSAEAQQPKKVPRIGYLDYGAAIDRDEAFFQALRDLGWIEGKNIAIEYRWAVGGREDRPTPRPGKGAGRPKG
jgi:putative ABC transport system substrate-binding protein